MCGVRDRTRLRSWELTTSSGIAESGGGRVDQRSDTDTGVRSSSSIRYGWCWLLSGLGRAFGLWRARGDEDDDDAAAAWDADVDADAEATTGGDEDGGGNGATVAEEVIGAASEAEESASWGGDPLPDRAAAEGMEEVRAAGASPPKWRDRKECGEARCEVCWPEEAAANGASASRRLGAVVGHERSVEMCARRRLQVSYADGTRLYGEKAAPELTSLMVRRRGGLQLSVGWAN